MIFVIIVKFNNNGTTQVNMSNSFRKILACLLARLLAIDSSKIHVLVVKLEISDEKVKGSKYRVSL